MQAISVPSNSKIDKDLGVFKFFLIWKWWMISDCEYIVKNILTWVKDKSLHAYNQIISRSHLSGWNFQWLIQKTEYTSSIGRKPSTFYVPT